LDQYEILLESIKDSEEYTLTLSFDSFEDAKDRLVIYEDYQIKKDALDSNLYSVYKDSVLISTIRYAGSEAILYNEYSRLELTSTDFYLRFVEVHYLDKTVLFNPLESTGIMIIVTLCSLLPFILEVPSVLEDLQEVIDAEVANFRVYGALLRLFIPILTVSLTLYVLQSLEVLRW
jgi:hypothetical protein